MQTTNFYILLNFKTATGYESFGKFSVGNNRKLAYTLFKKLKGNTTVNEDSLLTIELMETFKNLPLNLKIISCSLEELVDNCRIITREMFRAINLEEL